VRVALSARTLVEAKIVVHAMFMASGDPFKRGAFRLKRPYLRASATPPSSWDVAVLFRRPCTSASAAVTDRSIASPLKAGNMLNKSNWVSAAVALTGPFNAGGGFAWRGAGRGCGGVLQDPGAADLVPKRIFAARPPRNIRTG
jgi:hypothetical protein